MSTDLQITVPDLGDFDQVELIEVLVAVGDSIDVEAPLISLESDKATMEVPSTHAGTITAIHVQVGDKLSTGDLIATLDVQTSETESAPSPPAAASLPSAASVDDDDTFDVVVIGAGPGGYTAAFRAADLGLKTAMIERYPDLGGVCLNVGCIPSKALLHAAKVISDAREMSEHGISFTDPEIDLDKLRGWKSSIISQLTGGLAGLARKRKVTVFKGTATFSDPHALSVDDDGQVSTVRFKQAIIAAGSESIRLPNTPDDERIIDSTGALELRSIPSSMLVIGGGIIGLEMACVYSELGSKITIVELMDDIMAGADPDLVKPFKQHVAASYANIYTQTRVGALHSESDGIRVEFESDGNEAPDDGLFDAVLLAVGRRPNGHSLGADKAGVHVTDRGFIEVDAQQRTNVAHIFAIGDVVGQPMLAHKAAHEGKIAAEVAAGEKSAFDARVIPSVAYTDPEVAWVGLTELDAKANGIAYEKAVFPWAASGRSLSLGRKEGLTKLLFDPETDRVIGAGIVGPHAGDLIAEAALAIEMGCDAQDIGLTIHPHPTLSETIAFTAEAFEGTLTDLYMPKKNKR